MKPCLRAMMVAMVGTCCTLSVAQVSGAQSSNSKRTTLEGYVADYSKSTDLEPDRSNAAGAGLRLIFGRGGVQEELRSFFARAGAGAFFTYTPAQGSLHSRTYNVGLEADVPIFSRPPSAAFDPFISLAAGIFGASTRTKDVANGPVGTTTSTADFAVTPGIGAYIPAVGPIRLRGDLRDVITFGNQTRNSFVAEGGLALSF